MFLPSCFLGMLDFVHDHIVRLILFHLDNLQLGPSIYFCLAVSSSLMNVQQTSCVLIFPLINKNFSSKLRNTMTSPVDCLRMERAGKKLSR